MNVMIHKRKRVSQVRNLVIVVEHTYAQRNEVHTRDGHLEECFLLGIGFQDAKDIKKDLLGS
jgi:O-acetylhomoserine/O-acetylserine sulfhydrylase-like pyridoxal-dependent enzyme